MSTGNQQRKAKADDMMNERAGVENFVRLQEHQEEFLKWLEKSEKNPAMDRYVYKKIR